MSVAAAAVPAAATPAEAVMHQDGEAAVAPLSTAEATTPGAAATETTRRANRTEAQTLASNHGTTEHRRAA